MPDSRQWFLADAAYLEPVVTSGKYLGVGREEVLSPGSLADVSVSSLLSWLLGTA